mgnify:CR=1 FL=1
MLGVAAELLESLRLKVGKNGWGAFRSRCRDELDFDPETEADVVAGERLGRGEGPWSGVWARFAEAPASYGEIAGLLRRSRPGVELPFARERWPDLNDQDEGSIVLPLVGGPAHMMSFIPYAS